MTVPKWAWMLGIPASLVALGTFVTVTWPILGYETPSRHNADVIELRMGIANTAAAATALRQSIAQEIKGLSDLVLCGQLEQRLKDRMAELQDRRRRDEQNNINIEREIEQLRERMGPNGLNCSQFG